MMALHDTAIPSGRVASGSVRGNARLLALPPASAALSEQGFGGKSTGDARSARPGGWGQPLLIGRRAVSPRCDLENWRRLL